MSIHPQFFGTRDNLTAVLNSLQMAAFFRIMMRCFTVVAGRPKTLNRLALSLTICAD
jgi:hypothetical protein